MQSVAQYEVLGAVRYSSTGSSTVVQAVVQWYRGGGTLVAATRAGPAGRCPWHLPFD